MNFVHTNGKIPAMYKVKLFIVSVPKYLRKRGEYRNGKWRKNMDGLRVAVHGSALRRGLTSCPPADIDLMVFVEGGNGRLVSIEQLSPAVLQEAERLGREWARSEGLSDLPLDIRASGAIGVPAGILGPRLVMLAGENRFKVIEMREMTSALRLAEYDARLARELVMEILLEKTSGLGGNGANLSLNRLGTQDLSRQEINWYGGESAQATASALRHMPREFAESLGELGELLLSLPTTADELVTLSGKLAAFGLIRGCDCDNRLYLRRDGDRVYSVVYGRRVELEAIRALL